MEIKKVSYAEISSTLHTGDLILLSGQLFTSELTQFIQGSKWSHVAMVIRPEDIGINYPRLILWESNTLLNLKDVGLDHPKIGPMLVDLEERIHTDKVEKYDDLFQIRYLDHRKFDKDELHERLKGFIKKIPHFWIPEFRASNVQRCL